MRRSRLLLMVVAITSLAAVLTACGGASASDTGGSSPGTQQSSGGSSATVSTADVANIGKVLVNADGFTLYYLQTDAHNSVTCTGNCATTWPPELVTATPKAVGLRGTLGTIANPAGGEQLTYDGWPLYSYTGDSAPGQANGQGSGGVWFAMTPAGPSGGTSVSGSTGSSGGGRY
jgi:predicted lipoprotein with Yx(FWY)xxD motif